MAERNYPQDGHGVAKLKPEFILTNHRPTVDIEYVSKAVKDQIEEITKDKSDDSGPPSKRIKLKGRNKQRPEGKRIVAGDKLCPAYVQERECSFGGKCKFSHDRKKIMDNKAADIGPECYLYETYGKCQFGITCRFAKSHISEDFKNLSKPDADKLKNRADTVTNILSKDLQHSLWKRRFNFSKSDEVLDKICPFANFQKKRTQTYAKNKADIAKKALESTKDVEKASGNVEKSGEVIKEGTAEDNMGKSDDVSGGVSERTQAVEKAMENKQNAGDIHASETAGSDNTNIADGSGLIKKGANGEQGTGINTVKDHWCTENISSSSNIEVVDSKLDVPTMPNRKVLFSDKLYLAPLTTVGNLPFRRICKRFGADITCGEMAVCTNLLQGQQSEWALLKRHESEDMFGVQLCGGYPDSMTRCSQLICDTMDVDFIDINCGCPIELIYNKGEGSALMGRQSKFELIINGMKSVMNVPLTVKLRTGIYDNNNIAHTIVPHLRDWGVAMTTVHGRTRRQRYTKTADWNYIDECAQVACPMPVFGNGDILSYEEANLHREQTGVSGVMVARGALIKPWIFTEIKEQRHWDISSTERFDMLKDYANYGLDHWGSDHQGVENTRRFILEWLSFLYRYIPVGILERVPQQINARPPFYRGRDEMETLMASPNCGDWIKISEKLLGPVPDGFSFLPKHKANAYK